MTKLGLRTAKIWSLSSYQARVQTQQQCNQTEFIVSLRKEILRDVLEKNITCG